ncbi:MAG: hypothetical protein AB4290_20285 [Spirulina sp.]
MTMGIQEIVAVLGAIGVIAGALAAAINKVDELQSAIKKLEPTIEKLKPAIKLLSFFGIQIISIGTIIWSFLYFAVTNSNRLSQPSVFLLLVVEGTVAIVVYVNVWTIWLYPKLRRWLLPWKNTHNHF